MSSMNNPLDFSSFGLSRRGFRLGFTVGLNCICISLSSGIQWLFRCFPIGIRADTGASVGAGTKPHLTSGQIVRQQPLSGSYWTVWWRTNLHRHQSCSSTLSSRLRWQLHSPPSGHPEVVSHQGKASSSFQSMDFVMASSSNPSGCLHSHSQIVFSCAAQMGCGEGCDSEFDDQIHHPHEIPPSKIYYQHPTSGNWILDISCSTDIPSSSSVGWFHPVWMATMVWVQWWWNASKEWSSTIFAFHIFEWHP